MSIEAVIFDADGVVIFPWRAAQLFEREYGITREMTRGFFGGIFDDCLVGKADLKAVLPPYLAQWGWPASVDDFTRVWFEAEHAPDERVIGIIRALQRSGYTCCLATNQEKYRAEYIKTEMGFVGTFDHLFFSCELGCKKPDRVYYERITETLEMEGPDVLFWDDSPSSVEGARASGWNAEVYTGFEDFVTKLASHLGIGLR
jgi:putative hydrolase of the HAD superfamily